MDNRRKSLRSTETDAQMKVNEEMEASLHSRRTFFDVQIEALHALARVNKVEPVEDDQDYIRMLREAIASEKFRRAELLGACKEGTASMSLVPVQFPKRTQVPYIIHHS